MKKLYIIRHAKSSWSDPSLRDFDRPLNKRGMRDAPFMAQLMVGKGIQPDQIVSSPANRAITTAGYFAEAQNISRGDIVVKHEIYEAYPEVLLSMVRRFDKDLNTVFIFGHNPGFTYLANTFEGDYIPNLPTCGVVEISANIEDWAALSEDNGKITGFYFPKQHF